MCIRDSNGVIKNVAHRRYFIEGMSGKETLSDPLESSVDQETRVVLGVPVYRGDEVIGIVCGSYNVTALSQTMLNDTFGGVGYSLIVTAEGEIIAHHGDPVYQKALTYGENFFDFYSENYNLNDLERVQNDFSQGNQGLLELNIPQQDVYKRQGTVCRMGFPCLPKWKSGSERNRRSLWNLRY